VAQTQVQKKRIVIANAFSVNMLATNDIKLRFRKISLDLAKEIVRNSNNNYLSVVGHEGTAILLSNLLGVEIPVNRVNYVFNPTDTLLVFTIPFRLPEGKTLTYEEVKKVKDAINIFAVEVA